MVATVIAPSILNRPVRARAFFGKIDADRGGTEAIEEEVERERYTDSMRTHISQSLVHFLQ